MKNLKLTVAGLLLISGTTFAQIITQPAQQPVTQGQAMPSGQTNQGKAGQTTRTTTQQQVNTAPTQVPVTADGQTIITNSQSTEPVVNGQTQPVTTFQESETVQQTLPVNTGQVPKVYTNTTDALPFRDRQPKPTGRISPSNMPARRSNP